MFYMWNIKSSKNLYTFPYNTHSDRIYSIKLYNLQFLCAIGKISSDKFETK